MYIKSFIISQVLLISLCSVCIFSQTPAKKDKKLNFDHSKNPPAKSAPKPRKSVVVSDTGTVKPASGKGIKKKNDSVAKTGNMPVKPRFESVAKKTRDIAKKESLKSLKLTEIYRVGNADVLFISLQESKSSYYTVLSSGSIDYPLAGGLVPVSGLTVDEIEEVLRDNIQLYENPDVSVKVRDHASHAIDVLGLVARTGKQYLQREAMPLYVIRAQAVADSNADFVIVKRAGKQEIELKIGSPEFDETLIYPGDVVEFTSSASRAAANGYVYIGGSVNDTGRFGYHSGMTLTQAVMAAGGVKNQKIKKAVLRRKDEAGYLKSKSFKLSDIKKGKAVDPVLQAGDMIEVGS